MKNYLLILGSLLLVVISNLHAQEARRKFLLSDTTRYSENTGYGYDFIPSPSKGSIAPFYFSIRVPDGNYLITVKIGNKKRAGVTTVRAESRRLFVDGKVTKKGEFVEESFVVNKRTTFISETESVNIKPREKEYLTWDNRLTLEFNGEAPVCESISIEPAPASTITVFLCGNSTVVDQNNEPWASWGQMIPNFFNSEVCFANYAESGESANTFINAGRLKKALTQMKEGDYFFIEFGHNDQKQTGPGKGAYYSFMTSLKIFIDEVRARGGNPVLITPTQRRRFDANGRIQDSHGEYPDAMRWLAAKESVPLIDLNELTRTLYESLGEETSKRAFVHYPANSFPGQKDALADNTHFNAYGAYQVAKCVIAGMEIAVPQLTSHRKPGFRYNPAKPDDFNTFHWDPAPFFRKEKPDGD